MRLQPETREALRVVSLNVSSNLAKYVHIYLYILKISIFKMFRGQHLPCFSQLIQSGVSGLHGAVGS